MANDAWKALSDDHNSKGEPLPPEPDGPLDDLWEHLTIKQQQLVASGRVTLEELVERVTAAENADLCPRCAAAPVSRTYRRLGLCVSCARQAMTAALDETLLEIEAQREADRIKQRIHRGRESAGLPLPRSGGTSKRHVRPASEYGRAHVPATEIPVGTPLHECRVCGFTWHGTAAEDGLCVECRERAERRETAQAHGDARGEVSSTGKAGADPANKRHTTHAGQRTGQEAGSGRAGARRQM